MYFCWKIYQGNLIFWFLQLNIQAFQQNFGKIGYFWQIDSLHYDTNYTTIRDKTTNCWISHQESNYNVALKPGGYYGDYECNSPYQLIESTLQFMKSSMGDEVDFILWTGNSVPQLNGFTSQEGSQVLSKMTDLFKQTFPYTSVYPALGNLDLFPQPFGTYKSYKWKNKSRFLPLSVKQIKEDKNFDKQQEKILQKYKEVSQLWKNWLPPKAVETLKKGGYYMIELAGHHRLRLVCINMNLYLEEKKYIRKLKINLIDEEDNEIPRSNFVEDPLGQWSWLTEVMENAKTKKQNVILFGHISPGMYERGYSSSTGIHWIQEKYNNKYLSIVKKYADIITGQFFGHQHSNSFRLFKNEHNLAISWAMLAPSVSPFKAHIDDRFKTHSTNPSVRLYKYDAITGEILDYAQYYMNLKEANKKENLEFRWKLEYNFTSLYGVSKISAATLQSIADNFKINRTTFNRYIRHNDVSYEEENVFCDDRCKTVQLCAIENVEYSQYIYCITKASIASSSAVASRASNNKKPPSILFILFITLLVCVCKRINK